MTLRTLRVALIVAASAIVLLGAPPIFAASTPILPCPVNLFLGLPNTDLTAAFSPTPLPLASSG